MTIVDDTIVKESDIRTNFFLEPSNIGMSKAQATATLLQELNEDATVLFENNKVKGESCMGLFFLCEKREKQKQTNQVPRLYLKKKSLYPI